MTKKLPPPDILRKLLRYEPDTGKLFWLPRPVEMFTSQRYAKSWNTKHAGVEALRIADGRGYFAGTLMGEMVLTHRVAWAIATGKWPTRNIDHINGIKNDNRLSNLREATTSENGMNRGMQANNTSGYKGVSWCKYKRKWVATIRVNRVGKILGRFASPEDAYEAYCKAVKSFHGEFANDGRNTDAGRSPVKQET